VKEWFSERLAWANDRWAQDRMALAVSGTDSWFDRMAKVFRQLLRRVAELMDFDTALSQDGADGLTVAFRRFLNQGARWQEAGELRFANRNDKPRANWSEVQPGDRWDYVKKLMPKAVDQPKQLDIGKGWDAVIQELRARMKAEPTAITPDGERILVAAPETGPSDPLSNRARHLTGRREKGMGSMPRTMDDVKARYAANIWKTLEDYSAKVKDGAETLYFRKYGNGLTHMVVVDGLGQVSEHENVDGVLVTQYTPESSKTFRGATILKTRKPATAPGKPEAGTQFSPVAFREGSKEIGPNQPEQTQINPGGSERQAPQFSRRQTARTVSMSVDAGSAGRVLQVGDGEVRSDPGASAAGGTEAYSLAVKRQVDVAARIRKEAEDRNRQARTLDPETVAQWKAEAERIRQPQTSEVKTVLYYPDFIRKAIVPDQFIFVQGVLERAGLLRLMADESGGGAEIIQRAIILSSFHSGARTEVLGKDQDGNIWIEQPRLRVARAATTVDRMLAGRRAVWVDVRHPLLGPEAIAGTFVVQGPDNAFYLVSDLRHGNVGRLDNAEVRVFDVLAHPLSDFEMELPQIRQAVEEIMTQQQDRVAFARRGTAVEEIRIESKGMPVEQTVEALRELAGKELTNLETGIRAQINSEQRNKIISLAAVKKSQANGFTANQHNAAAAKIDALWKHAVLAEERGDVAGDLNIVSIKRFASPLVIDNETAVAWMTVKESVAHGHRIYSLELMEIEKLRNKGGTPNGDTTSAALRNKLAQLWDNGNHDIRFARRNPTSAAQRLASVDRLMSDALQELNDLQGVTTMEARQRRAALKKELQQYKEDRAALLIELDEMAANAGTDVDPAASTLTNSRTPPMGELPKAKDPFQEMLDQDTFKNRWWEQARERARDFLAGFVSELPELPVFGRSKAGLPTSHFALFREGYRLLRGATESVKEDARQELLRILEPINKEGATEPGSAYNIFREVLIARDFWFRSRQLAPGFQSDEDGAPKTLPLPRGMTPEMVEARAATTVDRMLAGRRAVWVDVRHPLLGPEAIAGTFVVQGPDNAFYLVSDLRHGNVGRLDNDEVRVFDVLAHPLSDFEMELPQIRQAVEEIMAQQQDRVAFARRGPTEPDVDSRGIHRLAKPTPSRYDSQDEADYDPAAILDALLSPGGRADQAQPWKHGRRLASVQRLYVRLGPESSGRSDRYRQVVSKEKPLGGGREHSLYLNPTGDRVINGPWPSGPRRSTVRARQLSPLAPWIRHWSPQFLCPRRHGLAVKGVAIFHGKI
jgi:hypothetical protein